MIKFECSKENETLENSHVLVSLTAPQSSKTVLMRSVVMLTNVMFLNMV